MSAWFRDGFLRVRLYYVLIQGAFGAYLPFINVHFAERGLSGREIGVLAAVPPIMTLLVAPAWGAAADRSGSRLRVLRWVLAGTAGGVLLLGAPRTFWLLLPAMGLFMLFQVAIIPLGDAVVAAAAAEKDTPYGLLRLWGSVGFALGGLLMGQLESRFGLGAIFPLYALLTAAALPLMWRMVPPEVGGVTGTRPSGVRTLLQDRPLALILLIAGVAATGITVGYLFLFVFLDALGASAGLIGAVSAVGALVEVPFMLWGGRLIQRRGAPPVFAAGMGLFALGWGLYAILESPTLAPAIQALNGAALGLLWPAGVTFVARRAPAGQAATAQALLSAVMYGVAPLLAAQVAGVVYDLAGARVVLAVAAGAMALGVLLFSFLRGQLGAAPGGQPPSESHQP
jgi:PPP family 3-phenylpropionic acid transporter